jgi:hypothetical protein
MKDISVNKVWIDLTMKKVMKLAFKLLGAFLGILLANSAAYAHGGVSIEFDKCVMMLGPYRMHLTGYQPQASAGEEFCEDIPAVGKALIVLDVVDNPLRQMMTGVRIIEKDSWQAAQSTTGDEQAKTVIEVPPKLYKTGSMTIDHTFDQPGYFVGFVTVEKEGNKMTSRFPFSVGYGLGSLKGGGTTPYIYAGLALLIAAAGAFYYFRSKKANQVTV